ncbi:MAG: cell division protein FtsZ [Candidatus Jordarchaeum sp.]|uniref:cell division protein FtsZ n=1 Tax=Candidatus Jordarchaeum sp. TaxID=2823881 RepID=UPI004049E810
MNQISQEVINTQGYKDLFSSETVDKQLYEILNRNKVKVQVFGVGGAGNNAVTRLMENSVEDIETIAVNTDAQDLLYTNSDCKLLIGKKITGGLGAGNNPEIGLAAAQESLEDIRKAVSSDMVFVVCGLGGGTGTGAAPIVADTARKSGALTISICFLPFLIEGEKRWQNAIMGLKKLYKSSDAVIIIPNERLLEVTNNVSLTEAFNFADEVLTKGVTSMAELVTKPGLVNVDLADVRTVVKNSGVAFIGVGESNGEERATKAVEKALNNPLLEVNIEGARAALVNISGDQNLTVKEAELIVRMLSERINQNSEIIWGALINPKLEDTLHVTIVVGGASFPYIEQLIKNFETKTNNLNPKEITTHQNEKSHTSK